MEALRFAAMVAVMALSFWVGYEWGWGPFFLLLIGLFLAASWMSRGKRGSYKNR